MLKELTPTPQMIDRLTTIHGGDFNVSSVAIFECVSVNTLPISKRGSLFDGACFDISLLHEMASHLAGEITVPLHDLHMQGYELPIGVVFSAEVFNNELRALFYIGRNTAEGVERIAKINSNTINEVSVGVRPLHAFCSECGWDYLGAGATSENIWERTCANGHTLGKDGAHLELRGLDRWLELSLVSLGAAQGAKIVGRAKSLLGQDEYQRLAASGVSPDITTLFATFPSKGAGAMADDPKQPSLDTSAGFILVASLAEDKAKLSLELTAAQSALTASTQQVETLTARVTELTASLEAAAEGVKIKKEYDEIVSFLSEQTRAALVASGQENPSVPATVPEMLAALNDSKLKLHNLPTGRQTQSSGDLSASTSAVSNAAFRTRK